MYAVRSKSGHVLRRFATRAEAEAFTRGLTAHSPSAKDPRAMTGPEINKELDRLDKKSSEIGTKMIAEGRGHETYSDTYKIGRGYDPLTDAWIDCAERQSALRNEISLRYGPRAPSRLPRGFGPRKTSYSPTSLKPREVQRVFEAHLASGKGRAAAASLTIRDLENPRVPHGDLVQAVERVSHLKKYAGRSPVWSQTDDTQPGMRHPRDELHRMTMLLVRRGVPDPAAKAWGYQQRGVSLPELEFRLGVGERMSPTDKRIAEVRPHLRNIGTRLAQGEAAFIETLMAHGGISKPEAERVYQTYRKLKVLKRDVASGVISVKHGGFLDRDTILRALEKP